MNSIDVVEVEESQEIANKNTLRSIDRERSYCLSKRALTLTLTGLVRLIEQLRLSLVVRQILYAFTRSSTYNSSYH